MSVKDRETYQYITFKSIKTNFGQVFGKNNDAMAEILFIHMSDCHKHNSELNSIRVNFYTFLKKFELLWPQKPEPKRTKDEAVAAQELFLKN